MEQKICPRCNEAKLISDFHKSKKRGTQTYCKICRKQIDKDAWKKQSSDPQKKIKKYIQAKNYKDSNRKRIFQFLLDKCCVDCGNKDPIVLTFDHQYDKEFEISNAISQGLSWERIKKEIDKCLVRCANCHIKKTAKDFNWYTYKFSNQGVAQLVER